MVPLSRTDPRGHVAEAIAREHLEALGWRILGSNVRVGRLEIDLLARDGDVLIVVEVRGRGPTSWQRPLDSVDFAKRGRLRAAAAQLWTSRYRQDRTLQRVRFDLVAVTWDAAGRPAVEHVRAAF